MSSSERPRPPGSSRTENDPPGESYAEPLPGKKNACFSEKGVRMVGARMQLRESENVDWPSISVFVGTRDGKRNHSIDLTECNEMLLTGYIPKNVNVSLRLVQPDAEEKNGYEQVLTGTGDSSTVYAFKVPGGTNYPDLANIYGTRFSPGVWESRPVDMKIFSYNVVDAVNASPTTEST